MKVHTSTKWKLGSASTVKVTLPTEGLELSHGPTPAEGSYAWFDVRVVRPVGLPRWVPLVYRLERLPEGPRPPTVTLESLAVLSREAAQALFGSVGSELAGVSLGFRFRGVAQIERHLPTGFLTGPTGLASPKGPKGPKDPVRPRAAWRWLPVHMPTPAWIVEAPERKEFFDVVEGLGFDLTLPPPEPILKIELTTGAASTGRVGLHWVRRHVGAEARIELMRERGGSWRREGTLSSAGVFEVDPAEPHEVPSGTGELEAQLGALAEEGAEYQVRIATVDGAHEGHSETFMVYTVAAQVVAPAPALTTDPLTMSWTLRPLPSEPASIELERYDAGDGGAWHPSGVLSEGLVFEDPPVEHELRPSSSSGTLSGLGLGVPGEAGGRLRVSLRVEALGLVGSSEAFAVAAPGVSEVSVGTTTDGRRSITWRQDCAKIQIWLDSQSSTGATLERSHVIARRQSDGAQVVVPGSALSNSAHAVVEFPAATRNRCVYDLPRGDTSQYREVLWDPAAAAGLYEGDWYAVGSRGRPG